jgi:glucokinase
MAGYVRWGVAPQPVAGRPPCSGLMGETHLILGIHLEIPTLNMVVANLNGDVLNRVHLADLARLVPDEAVSRIVAYVRQVQTTYPDRKLLGIGLAMPGFIDPPTGKILYSIRAPQWQNFPLKGRLESELGLPVIIENDVDCMTSAELAHAKIPDTTNMMYLGFSEGVKLSMLFGGQLITGPFGNTGIIGHMVTTPDDIPEPTSISGMCLAFDRRVAELEHPSETLQAIAALGDRSEKFKAILVTAESDPLCADIVTSVLDPLAAELSKLIQVLQPALLIIGGALSHLPPGLKVYMEKTIRSSLPLLINNHLVIRYASMVGSRVAAVGAVYRFLQRYDIERT